MSISIDGGSFDLDRVRQNLPVLSQWTYLNAGSYGLMAEPVLRSHLEAIADLERAGQTGIERAIADYERARAAVARLLNADPAGIAFCRNASDGANLVAAGFPLNRDDEVLTFAEENGSFVLAWNERLRRTGGRQRIVPVTSDPDELVRLLRHARSPRTRVVSVSHVVADTGLRIPVEVIRDAVGPDVAIVVDAAQSIGQFPVDVKALRADVVVGNGHKWLGGPKGTGFAWFSPAWMERIPPLFVGYETVEPRFTRGHYLTDPPPPLQLPPDATRYEYGTLAWHHYAGLAEAISYLERLGWDQIWRHAAAVSTYAKRRLADLPAVELITPHEWERSSGMLAFVLPGFDGRAVSTRLVQEWRIALRGMERAGGVRVCCAYFTTTEDVDRLVEAVAEIASGGATT